MLFSVIRPKQQKATEKLHLRIVGRRLSKPPDCDEILPSDLVNREKNNKGDEKINNPKVVQPSLVNKNCPGRKFEQ